MYSRLVLVLLLRCLSGGLEGPFPLTQPHTQTLTSGARAARFRIEAELIKVHTIGFA